MKNPEEENEQPIEEVKESDSGLYRKTLFEAIFSAIGKVEKIIEEGLARFGPEKIADIYDDAMNKALEETAKKKAAEKAKNKKS